MTDRLFTGQVYDGDTSAGGTGLYYYNARMYDPALGRFTQADTIVPEPSRPLAFDRYAYVYNNPVRYTDPSGHDPLDDAWKESFYQVHGCYPTAEDISIRLYSIAYPNLWEWSDFYRQDGSYINGSLENVFRDNRIPLGRDWHSVSNALFFMRRWYAWDEGRELARDVGTLFAGLLHRIEEPDDWAAISFSGNPARVWLHVRPNGLPSKFLDGDRDANVHHWAWGFAMGGTMVGGQGINTVREIKQMFDAMRAGNSNIHHTAADIRIGNAGVSLGAMWGSYGISSSYTYMRSQWEDVMGF